MVNETFIPVATAAATASGGGFSAGLDKFLAVVIPIVVFGMFGFMIYKAFKEPIDKLVAWVKNKWAEFNTEPEQQQTPRYSGIVFDSRAELYK
jgi:hypothetical protein